MSSLRPRLSGFALVINARHPESLSVDYPPTSPVRKVGNQTQSLSFHNRNRHETIVIHRIEQNFFGGPALPMEPDRKSQGAGKESEEARKVEDKQPDWANGLQKLYKSVVDEPLPDSFKDLLSKLDDKA